MGRIADALHRSGQLQRDAAAFDSPFSPEFATEPASARTAVQPLSRAPEIPDRRPRPTVPAAPPDGIDMVLPSNPRLLGQLTSPLVEEEYRTLGATLHRAAERSGIRSLVVTSTLPQEGKTLSTANVALVLSRGYGRRVLVIDADLRKPALHDLFGASRGPGLSDALLSGVAVRPVHVQPRLWLMPAGDPQAESANVLASDGMRRLLAEASREFDWVVIDTPPAGVLPDAQLLTAIADAAILVVRAGKTPYDLCRRAATAMSEGGKLLGVVLTRGAARQSAGYYATYAAATDA